MADAFGQIESCLGPLEFGSAALDILRLFRTSVLAESVSKRAKLPPPAHRFFDLCEELAQAEEHYVIGVKLAALRYVQQELSRRKDQLKVQSFDDLLTRLHRALVAGTQAAGQFPLTPALSPQGERAWRPRASSRSPPRTRVPRGRRHSRPTAGPAPAGPRAVRPTSRTGR